MKSSTPPSRQTPSQDSLGGNNLFPTAFSFAVRSSTHTEFHADGPPPSGVTSSTFSQALMQSLRQGAAFIVWKGVNLALLACVDYVMSLL